MGKKMIVCCGEALIDMLPRKSADGVAVYQPFNGGSIFNTAIALSRLGIRTGFFTGLSTDFFGDSLKAGLTESQVDLKYIKFWDKPSTLAFVKLDNGQARYSFFDDNSAGRMLTRKDLPKLDNPEMNPTSTARSILFWLGLGAVTFILLVAGYGSGFWKLAG